MDLGQQLLDLLIGALPTVIIVFFLFFFLRWAFWNPLERALAERRAATEGARQQADQAIARANEKLRQYEEALRQARAEVYRQQEAGRQQAVEERNRIVREARERANQSIRQAKLEIAADVDRAKKTLEAESERLAEEIAQSLLAPQPGDRRA
ncbi:MAG: ATP synthase F0 subunit B [Acidobacteria bacterium]|nr:ATP synthase F0 subunit B [Acidobacteriota bacterium]